jgi:hypothetical protein
MTPDINKEVEVVDNVEKKRYWCISTLLKILYKRKAR